MSCYQMSLEEIYSLAMEERIITSENRQVIQNAIWSNPLNQDENAIINRLFYNLRRGFIKLID